jgi:hypothetical protein
MVEDGLKVLDGAVVEGIDGFRTLTTISFILRF